MVLVQCQGREPGEARVIAYPKNFGGDWWKKMLTMEMACPWSIDVGHALE